MEDDSPTYNISVSNKFREMEEFQSPLVQRGLAPSPTRGTPLPSKVNIHTFYSSPVPPFVLEALDRAHIGTEIVDLPKHYLPEYSFRLVDRHPNPSGTQLLEIATHFPGCTGIAYTPPFLVVSWPQLPVKPWPLTVGGIPLFYASPEIPRPPTFGKASGNNPMLDEAGDRLRLWEDPGTLRTKHIAQSLVERGICMAFFGWSGVRWYVEVASVTDGAKLPATICGLLVSWQLYPEQEEAFRRSITPTAGTCTVVDRTFYQPTLRPGVMVESCSGRGSTSGIPLLGPDGQRWITVAKHSFPAKDEAVHHPCYALGGDNIIATVDFNFPDSNIGLAKLKPGMIYSSTSFDVDDANGTTLVGLVHSDDLGVFQRLYLDSPYNGKREGLLVSKGCHILPVGSSNGPFQYIECNMIYFGNGADDIFLGTCGSAIWTSDKEVAAFFRWYYTKDGVAYAPSVDVLIANGYTLQAIA